MSFNESEIQGVDLFVNLQKLTYLHTYSKIPLQNVASCDCLCARNQLALVLFISSPREIPIHFNFRGKVLNHGKFVHLSQLWQGGRSPLPHLHQVEHQGFVLLRPGLLQIKLEGAQENPRFSR